MTITPASNGPIPAAWSVWSDEDTKAGRLSFHAARLHRDGHTEISVQARTFEALVEECRAKDKSLMHQTRRQRREH